MELKRLNILPPKSIQLSFTDSRNDELEMGGKKKLLSYKTLLLKIQSFIKDS
jgi:hypothetical protein